MRFSNLLILWYLQNKRDLPWRKTKNPYKIWLSEIILQQTRVDQGMSYYYTFVKNYPTVFDLAKASEEEVLKDWQGLGYYSRARNLHYSARYIVNELSGIFPSTYSEIIKLKGVGDYTASAIASISFNEPTAVVDGNVYRVLARYFGITTPINSAQGIKDFKNKAQQLIDKDYPGEFNQAIMEFGARQCKPQSPNCSVCVLNNKCVAFHTNTIKNLPVKEKKLKIKKRYFNYLVVKTPSNKTILEKRTSGIWKNMYQFPLIESKKELSKNELLTDVFFTAYGSKLLNIQLFNAKNIVHKLSHQHIYTKFWIVDVEAIKGFELSWDELSKYPVSKLIDNFLTEYNSN
jgi:A/G-specific adenine glycosylase